MKVNKRNIFVLALTSIHTYIHRYIQVNNIHTYIHTQRIDMFLTATKVNRNKKIQKIKIIKTHTYKHTCTYKQKITYKHTYLNMSNHNLQPTTTNKIISHM